MVWSYDERVHPCRQDGPQPPWKTWRDCEVTWFIVLSSTIDVLMDGGGRVLCQNLYFYPCDQRELNSDCVDTERRESSVRPRVLIVFQWFLIGPLYFSTLLWVIIMTPIIFSLHSPLFLLYSFRLSKCPVHPHLARFRGVTLGDDLDCSPSAPRGGSA